MNESTDLTDYFNQLDAQANEIFPEASTLIPDHQRPTYVIQSCGRMIVSDQPQPSNAEILNYLLCELIRHLSQTSFTKI